MGYGEHPKYKISDKVFGTGFKMDLGKWAIEVSPLEKNKRYNIEIFQDDFTIKDIDIFSNNIEDAKEMAIDMFKQYLLNEVCSINRILETLKSMERLKNFDKITED